jgi:hypothetical protein
MSQFSKVSNIMMDSSSGGNPYGLKPGEVSSGVSYL